MGTRTYKYGCGQPDKVAEIYEIMRLAHKYRNKLAEIELERRKRTDEHLLECCPELVDCERLLAEADAAVEKKLAAIKAANAKARTKVDTAEDKRAVKELRAARKDLYQRRKELRTAAFGDALVQAGLAAITEDANAAVRAARAACGIYWGTYLLVEDSASKFRQGAPPRYTSFRGEGRCGVQIQGGLSWDTLVGGQDTRVRLVPRAWSGVAGQPEPSAARREKYRELWLRIASDGVAPVWARVPVILHREPPAGVAIKWVVLHRRLEAGRAKWYVTFSLEGQDASFLPRDLSPDGGVGVDIGYRIMPSGRQRIAVARGTDGEQHELYLPRGMVDEWEKLERIQSHRDELFDAIKASLVSWLEYSVDVPAWLTERLKHLAQWRSARRLDEIVLLWSQTAGVPGDEALIRELVAWRERERHLWSYQECLRQQLMRWRQNLYREWSAMLRQRYARVYLERIDLRETLHDTLVPEEERETVTAQRRAANRACISQLNAALKQCGMESLLVRHAGTTAVCCECGHWNQFADESALKQQCDGCHRTFDRDENAAVNILARGEVAWKERQSLAGDGETGVTATAGGKQRSAVYQRRVAARERRAGAKRQNEIE